MARTTVFHIITRLELGGAQGNTLHTCAHLDPARFAVSLACGRGGMLDPTLKDAAYPVHFIPQLNRAINPVKDALALRSLYLLLKKHRPAIVHTHSSKAGILGRLAARMAGVPVIIHTFHGFGFTPGQSAPVRKAFTLAEKFCAGFSQGLIFVSQANMEQARALGFSHQDRWQLIRSGIDLSAYRIEGQPGHTGGSGESGRMPDGGPRPGRKAALASLDLPDGARYVLCVANFKPQKNPLDFFRAAAEAAKTAPDVFFVYTGEGPLLERAKDLARALGIYAKCRFPGWRQDTPALMAHAEAFAMTSLWEGLPRAVVEALASGLPCALYAADGVRDIVRDEENGLLAAPGDCAGLARKLSALLGDSALREKLAAGARATDLKDFDIAEMVKSQERFYLELLEKWT